MSEEVGSCRKRMSGLQADLDQQRQRAEASESAHAEQNEYGCDMHKIDDLIVHWYK